LKWALSSITPTCSPLNKEKRSATGAVKHYLAQIFFINGLANLTSLNISKYNDMCKIT
jgi:hypothetical protein